jgi:hypothetical protein
MPLVNRPKPRDRVHWLAEIIVQGEAVRTPRPTAGILLARLPPTRSARATDRPKSVQPCAGLCGVREFEGFSGGHQTTICGEEANTLVRLLLHDVEGQLRQLNRNTHFVPPLRVALHGEPLRRLSPGAVDR